MTITRTIMTILLLTLTLPLTALATEPRLVSWDIFLKVGNIEQYFKG